MAGKYKRWPHSTQDLNEVIEAVPFNGKNIDDVAAFVGYIPEIIDKHKGALKIINDHATFKLVPGAWVVKGEFKGKEVFYVADNCTFSLQWNTNMRDPENYL